MTARHADTYERGRLVALCADCRKPLERRCDRCGDYESTHDVSDCDEPDWQPFTPDTRCESCAYYDSLAYSREEIAEMNARYGRGNW